MYQIVRTQALARKVLVVAVTDGRDWTAYIDAVPGESHRKEEAAVKENGDKLPHHIAKVMFPDLDEEYSWRE
jgi:hypothetical protein